MSDTSRQLINLFHSYSPKNKKHREHIEAECHCTFYITYKHAPYPGSYNSAVKQSSCSACPAGFPCSDGVKGTKCTAGNYSPEGRFFF